MFELKVCRRQSISKAPPASPFQLDISKHFGGLVSTHAAVEEPNHSWTEGVAFFSLTSLVTWKVCAI